VVNTLFRSYDAGQHAFRSYDVGQHAD